MHARVATLVLTLALNQLVSSFDSSNIVFVIVSQKEPYNAAVAKRLKQDIENQIQLLSGGQANVHLTHEDFPIPGDWTILPLFRPLLHKYKGSDVRWAVFLEPHTAVRCAKLVEALAAADGNPDSQWIGYPLTDEEPTIVHHFAYYEKLEDEGGLLYPNFASGFAMRLELMNTLLQQISSGQRHVDVEFSIDPSFELAQLIYGDKNDPGPLLTPDLSFCVVSADNCATYPRSLDLCGSPIPERSIFFAVKTWSGFHKSRVKVVKKTWGRHVSNLMFYSDKTDPSIPSINTGIPNTKTGHCMKTVAILRMAVEHVKKMPHIKWIFLADDDTILGVQRLTEVLSCYRGGSEFTALGRRFGYGYGIQYPASEGILGFDYITLGGGEAFSIVAAEAFSTCPCSSLDSPDDMALGDCARQRDYILTHSALFHQGRPQDYPRETLSRRPVSFHHHSSPEPIKVYATWFQHDDLAVRRPVRDEL